ncbi:protein OSB2, chloroplastic-like [Lactuca sativa]|uniref:protein OSB2, chloroplastic-like n=1 Tax=Lactuca sativa TaxID=4236 RepID=UPI000CD9C051|nr:protein OSB2, chloroplastic-like [Lactuca sativa]
MFPLGTIIVVGIQGGRAQCYTYSQYPIPIEVPWTKELCNSVQLIGNVGTLVEFKQLSSGKFLAWCRLAFKKSSTYTTWINLTFWDDLVHIASQHVEKGQQIYVSGCIVSDTVDSDDEKQQTYYKVVVQQLNFVERSPPSNDEEFNYNSNSTTSSMTTGRGGMAAKVKAAAYCKLVELYNIL